MTPPRIPDTCSHCGQIKPTAEEYKGWRVDLSRNHLVAPDGRWYRFTNAELEIMYVLIRTNGTIVPRERVIQAIWGRGTTHLASIDSVLNTLISKTRKTIRAYNLPLKITNSWAQGWYLEVTEPNSKTVTHDGVAPPLSA